MNGKYYHSVRHDEKKEGRAEPSTYEVCSETVIVSVKTFKKLLLIGNGVQLASS